ncbi:ABC transporter substrate-binding protein [Geobacillus thermoleovorans]|uniref:Branched chain amino acid ABC transporter (Substrate-binding protein) n=3 Tax=Geobacillus thermoleovorans group TaxID=1505648 RepID=Q5KVM1_GEOKA|nr:MULTISPECIES: ABC transporter substrate-binding protein [Geobacillus thermoleovorans group]AUI38299.1 ethanolamine utilization protein EutJ [[Bacillus] caldolyticus]MED3665928.1 ABC transporter substrate-binding protein [Geobacillus kaustophilus]MED4971441.1 ABC transporter substrate-binding protein [Geobacillus thermoleovorans]QCK84116.1 ABC transporter substrate-binding protein [Geobacillus kaustophilus NBRC 102445]QDY75115.1 ABC transporter substrate-binding protein [Geobacillus thermole
MKKKRAAGVFFSLMLTAGLLAGCGGNQQGGSSSGGNSGGGGGGDVIKIGANLELSGGVASYGQSIAEGLDLALEEINKEGINGKKLELVKVDNKSEAAEATNGAIKLISQDKVVAIIGSATSTNTLAQVQVANDNKVPLITPTGTNPTITNKDGKVNEFVFRTCFIDPFQGTVAAKFALNELKVKNAAVLIDSSSDYSKGLAASFKDAFTQGGGKIVAEEAYVAKDTDFRATLTRIKSKNPEFIFLPGYYEEVGLIVKQARELGLNVPIMGGDGWDSPKLVEIAGKDALNNTYITNHYSSGDPDPKIQEFVKAFKAKYNKAPDAFNALGYDTAYFLADAIKRAGSADPVKIKDALAQTKDLQLVSGTMTLNENHDPVKSAAILEYKDGQQQFKTKVNP